MKVGKGPISSQEINKHWHGKYIIYMYTVYKTECIGVSHSDQPHLGEDLKVFALTEFPTTGEKPILEFVLQE